MAKYDSVSASGPKPDTGKKPGTVEHVSIEPSDNGGFTVSCRKTPPKAKKGDPYHYQPADSYVYTSLDDMLTHVRELFGGGQAKA